MNTNKPKVLIVAPHIDDEMIGCWSVLCRSLADEIDLTVLYLYDLSDVRMHEALQTSFAFKFTALLNTVAGRELCTAIRHAAAEGRYAEVYVPSRRDWHADHQATNREYRKWATHFYSVDMAHGVPLDTRHAKYDALEFFYPSQSTLWRTNEKYWLFEDIQGTDYAEYRTLTWTQHDGRRFSVTALVDYAPIVDKWYKEYAPRALQFVNNRKECVDSLLAVCGGRVVIEYDGYRVEA